MSDQVNRLNAALEGRYAIERELGEGGIAIVTMLTPGDQQFVMLRLGDTEDEPSEFILVENWADEFMGRVGN